MTFLRCTTGFLLVVTSLAVCAPPQCPMPQFDPMAFLPCLNKEVPQSCCAAANPIAAHPCVRVWFKLPQLAMFQAQIEKARIACNVPALAECGADVKALCPAECGVKGAAPTVATKAPDKSATCGLFSTCAQCTMGSCRWQGNTCNASCGISAIGCVASSGSCPAAPKPTQPAPSPAPAPADKDVTCATLATCGDCTKQSCHWEGHSCKGSCGISAISCLSTPASCPAPTPATDMTATCPTFSTCDACTKGSCRWHGGSCVASCGISAVNCMSTPGACPATAPVAPPDMTVTCPTFASCGDCIKGSCRWQAGSCKASCGLSAINCVSAAGSCPVATTPVVAKPNCGVEMTCADYTAAGCKWQPVGDTKCLPSCMIMDTECYDGSQAKCPAAADAAKACAANEEYTDCTSSSCWETTCENGTLVRPGDFCTMDCREGCRCPDGRARLGSVCIEEKMCKPASACEKRRNNETALCGGKIGCKVTQCNDNGEFNPKQCWGSTGSCWCVDVNGTEVQGTRKNGDVTCPEPGAMATPPAGGKKAPKGKKAKAAKAPKGAKASNGQR